uniref:Transcriptional regulator, MerR family n=1 Tax=Cyanothece sp. (strain PCC 7425 / ATCC 29141) TaxID=395961 RepID=B8HS38_CYAP4
MLATTLLKIGDIAKQTGVSVGTLRYYETLKLLHPVERGNNGYRYYSLETIQQVKFIKKSQSLGFSLEEIRQILDVRYGGEAPCALVQDLLNYKIGQLEEQIKQMMMFKSELEGYRNLWAVIPSFNQNDHDICPLIDTVHLKTEVDPFDIELSIK